MAVTAVFAVHTFFAPHAAQAEVVVAAPAGGPVVAATLTPVAATAAAPAATPAVALPGVHPMAADVTRRPVVAVSAPTGASSSVACKAPVEFARFDRPLLHTMRRLGSGAPLTIVAIGSSSTAGAGASSPAASYPSRLADELHQRFPGRDITVLNRGVNGEETNEMMARFAADVIASHPQLVLWQVGTNSVLRDRPLDKHAALLNQGIDILKSINADVVLIDLQYSPAVIAKSETLDMLQQIELVAKEKNVDLFHRFAVMRDWHETDRLGFDKFVAADNLHMNDWSYGCLAKLLGAAVAEAATRPIASAAAHPAH